MYNILKLNEISNLIYNNLDKDNYSVSDNAENPDGIILRSFKMHDYPIPDSLLAVARAGAGVNNIPLDKMTEKGVVVFNTPGANANAVKELVITELLLSNRKLIESIDWVNSLEANDDMPTLVEKGKKAFIGPELLGKTLGVVGLGAIGRLIANAVIGLGMNVIGYDPFLTAELKADLNDNVVVTNDLDELFSKSNYITVHTPLTDSTREMINERSIALMPNQVRIINCARGELVNNNDIIKAVESGKVAKYISDFPTKELKGIKNIILVPHLGASTPEAEDNCAVMASKELKDYLENGNIVNSVNCPRLTVARPQDTHSHRVTVLAKANDNLLSNIMNALGNENVISVNQSTRGDITYIICDIKCRNCIDNNALNNINGVLKARVIK